MKFLPLFLAAVVTLPIHALAADAVKIDIYVAGSLAHSLSLTGPNSTVKFSLKERPDTTCELRLIAPEPVIVEVTETSTDGAPIVAGRAKMPTSGSSFAVSEIKGAHFRTPYVLVRRD